MGWPHPSTPAAGTGRLNPSNESQTRRPISRRNRAMKTLPITLTPDLYFSYSQFFVYDASVQMPACEWTKEHSDQGFARRDGTVAFGTLLEYGTAKVEVAVRAYQPRDDYERVIAVPFAVVSGKVIVDGPEETETGRERNFTLPPGDYRFVAAQRVTGDEEEAIDLFFESLAKPLERSAVLIADDALNPPIPLLETAGVAGEE